MEHDVEWTLGRIRGYLQVLARMHVGPQLQGKVDISGVVQQTLLEVYQANMHYVPLSSAQLAGFLRTILLRNLTDELRRLRASKRNAMRERSLDSVLEQSPSSGRNWLACDNSSPSQQAICREQRDVLAGALQQLPAEQRLVIQLHHLEGRPLSEVAERMGRSKSAVAGLLYRGLKRLRVLLDNRQEC